MSRERRWWGVPRSFAGFSLWRLSNPFDSGEATETAESKVKEVGDGESKSSGEVEPAREVEGSSDREKSPSKRLERSRSRSRSSSFSFKSRKSAERTTPEVEVPEVKRSTLPDISFTFISEQDRGDDYIVVDPSLKNELEMSSKQEIVEEGSPLKRRSEISCFLQQISSTEDSDSRYDSESPSSEEDPRVKRVEDSESVATETKHVSSVLVTMKPVDFSNSPDLKMAVENIVKEHDYEVLKEPAYSSPTLQCVPVYATIDKSNTNTISTLDSTSSKEFAEALPSIPTDKGSTLDSNSSKDFREALPSVPQPDWDEQSESSEYNADYAELTTPVVTPEPPTEQILQNQLEVAEDVPEVVEDLEYCQHRAELKPSLRRVTLLRCKKTVRRTPSIGRVKNKLGKAWKKVRGWWVEERVRLNDVILKRDSVRESSVLSDVHDLRSMSEEDVYAKLKEMDLERVRSVEDVASNCSTMPARYRRRRNKHSPTPGLSRSSSVAAFRRSRYFPEVSRVA